MATEFKLPELGEGVEEADVARIFVSEGDQIDADQNVMELETEKAVADLPCPNAGKVTKVHVSEGDNVKVGQTLLTIQEVEAENKEVAEDGSSGEKDESSGKKEVEAPKEAEEAEAEAEPDDGSGQEQRKQKDKGDADQETSDAEAEQDQESEQREADAEETSGESAAAKEEHANAQRQRTRDESGQDDKARTVPPAGPATRRLARKLSVDLDGFQLPEGDRIRPEDVVRAYVESGKAAALTSEPLPDFSRFGPVEREPLSKITQTAARKLTAAWNAIPHVTQHGQADITELDAARRRHAEQTNNAAPKITLTSIAVKAIAGLLKEFPKFNASLDMENDELILKKHYHIGVAVDTDHGLVVPVIRDVDRLSIEQIATELHSLAGRARRRQLSREDFEGGTFTISNQGGIGGGAFTPIVNHPELAILGMGRAQPELRLIDGAPTERLMLPLSLSYDHRAINGADAARFIERLADILSDEFTLLIAT